MSIEQKIKRNMFIAWYLGYRKDKQNNLVWSLIDFGYASFFNVLNGTCSLQASIDFSMDKFETEVNNDYHNLMSILIKG